MIALAIESVSEAEKPTDGRVTNRQDSKIHRDIDRMRDAFLTTESQSSQHPLVEC